MSCTLQIYKDPWNFWGWLLDRLGYTLFQEWATGRSWILEETYTGLVQTEEKHLNVAYHRKRTGLNHIAFKVDVEELEKIKRELASKHVSFLYADQALEDTVFLRIRIG